MYLLLPPLLITLYTVIAVNAGYEERALEAHNKYRAKHESPPMKLDPKLNEIARKCAEYYRDKGQIDHSCKLTKGKGENLASMGKVEDEAAAVKAVDLWYSEEEDFIYSKKHKNDFMKTGHFTQVVWVDSKKLGMGVAADAKTSYVVGIYSPPGNYQNEKAYMKNVKRPPGTGGSEQSRGILSRAAIIFVILVQCALLTSSFAP